MKKQPFIPPQVLQAVDICLEKDVLVGPSATLSAIVAGHDYFELDPEVMDEEWLTVLD